MTLKRPLLTLLCSSSEISLMQRRVDSCISASLLKIVNSHIFLLRYLNLIFCPLYSLFPSGISILFLLLIQYKGINFRFWGTQILHFIGNEGPKTSDPSKYIRYIYNRVILENATVRAAAVSTLAKFGALVGSLKVCQHKL